MIRSDARDPAIQAEGLTKHFGTTVAVDRLDLTIPAGAIFGLVGPDGAGKTTTMRLLCGIMRPTAGTARVAGCDIAKAPEGLKTKVGYLSQQFSLYEDLTVQENLDFVADVHLVPRRLRPQLLERLYGFSRLGPFKRRLAGNLSGGMRQKLALACAIIHSPSVLLLDEPTTGVDPVSRREFWKILYSLLAEGTTILISTSYMDEAERCMGVAMMHEGRLLVADAPERLKALLPHEMLEIACEPQDLAREVVASMPDALGIGVFGDRLHVAVSNVTVAQPVVAARLEEAGVTVLEMEPVAPSLEDVFVYLAEKGKARA